MNQDNPWWNEFREFVTPFNGAISDLPDSILEAIADAQTITDWN